MPKISFFGMIRPLLGGWGGIAIQLKKIYISHAIFEFPNPPCHPFHCAFSESIVSLFGGVPEWKVMVVARVARVVVVVDGEGGGSSCVDHE